MSSRHWSERLFDRLPGWPTERQWVTIATFGLVLVLLAMAHANPRLWDVEVFKVIIQAAVLTGLLNMILAFHFSANKGDEVSMWSLLEHRKHLFDRHVANGEDRVGPGAPHFVDRARERLVVSTEAK